MGIFSRKQSQDIPRRRRQVLEEQTRAPGAASSRYAFRRSQTLTGSLSAGVDSTGGKDAHLKSPRERAHELAEHRRHLLRILGVCLLVVAALGVFMWQFIAVVSVSATGGVAISDNKRYETVIQNYLQERPTERFRASLGEADLLDYIVTQLPEVEAIRIGAPTGLGGTNFELTMRRPVAGWSIGASQQYVDAGGVAFGLNYFDAPAVRIVDNSGIPADSGLTVASSRFLSFVGRVVALSAEHDYKAESVTIPAGTTRQIEVRYEGLPYPVKFLVDRPAGEQVEDMVRSIAHLNETGVVPQYLDVRVSRRAYYK